MKLCLSDTIREISASLLVLEKDVELPEHRKKKVVEPTKSITITKDRAQDEDDDKEEKIPVRRPLPDEISKDVKITKRPKIKPPRRISDYKAKWKGLGSRQTRKDYQKNYRKEHGNGYVKKITTKSGMDIDAVFNVKDHNVKQIAMEN